MRIVYRIAGAGTKEFSAYKAGDAVEIMGPLGNGFSETGKKPMVIGGGIGIPPMLGLAKSLKESGSDVTAVLGYRSELFLQDESHPAAAFTMQQRMEIAEQRVL